METSITKKLIAPVGDNPFNEFEILINSYATESENPGFNSWTIGIACILNTNIADNISVHILEGYEMIDKIAAAKQIDIDTPESGTSYFMWYIEIKKELEDFHSVVKAIAKPKTRKRRAATIVQAAT